MSNELNDDDVCCVCLETNTTSQRICKWECSHSFHTSCIERWNIGCPVCRNNVLASWSNNVNTEETHVGWTISRNPTCILDVERMKEHISQVPAEHIDIYKNEWKDRECIEANHRMIYFHTYGVIAICEDCNTSQSFNCVHNVVLPRGFRQTGRVCRTPVAMTRSGRIQNFLG